MELYITILSALLLAAFFSGMEIAFVSSNKLRFEVENDDTSLTSAIIHKFYRHPQQYITTMLIGGNVVLVIFSIKMNELLLPWFSFTQNDILLSFLVSLIATIVVLFFGEYIPKMLMRANPNAWLRVFSPLLYLIYIVLYPVALFCMWISRAMLRITGTRVPQTAEQLSFSRADLNYLVEENLEEVHRGIEDTQTHDSNTEESASENEIQILKNALEFSKVKVRDCYIPRTEIVAMPFETTPDELRQTFQESGFSKIPIYKGDIDNIIGYLHCSEMFTHRDTWHEHLNKIPFVPENMAAEKLMRMFMQQKKSIAVVVDEFGGTAGIVTLEDIFEEIFGEIEDEHDTREFTAKQVADNEIVASGRIEVEELNQLFSLSLPESEAYDTIAGMMLHHTGTFPKINEEISIAGYTLKCLKIADNRIERVKIII